MKRAISNIGWKVSSDKKVYNLMKKYEYSGLEIAPTRIFPENPYDKIEEAESWSKNLKKEYGFQIPSMQSIWYGRREKIFGSKEERIILSDYTRKAIDFASAIHCRNLVFGCPLNRNCPVGADMKSAVHFFRELGEYAIERKVHIGMEANPPIYHTNYMNDTFSVLDLIHEVNSEGFRLNLDIGAMIQNREEIWKLDGYVGLISHVHISEPGLKPVRERNLHKELKEILLKGKYDGFISIEMEKTEDLSLIEEKIQYVREVFQ